MMKKQFTLLILSLILSSAIASEFKTPEQITKASLQALIDNDVKTLKVLLSDELQSEIARDRKTDFATSVLRDHQRINKLITESGGLESITTENATYETEAKIKAKVKVILNLKNGKTAIHPITATKTASGWLISD